MIRIGRIIYKNGRRVFTSSFDGYTNIIVLMGDFNEWSILGPYDLKDDKGVIMENYYQYSKVYKTVPKTIKRQSRKDTTIIWNHPEEVHITDNNLTPEYYAWRKKGMDCQYAVRYPVGFNHRHNCLYALAENDDGTINEEEKLDYVQSRKKIYVKEYCRLVKQQPKFQELKNRLINGENLLIIEVDGPHQESLDYYREKYDVDGDFIQKNTMLVNEENINIMLNDTKHPFGHGYCLAMTLLDKDIEWNK
jgi:hypothetical protein